MRRLIDYVVFSRTWGYRLTRHLIFWLIYIGVFRVMLVAGPALAAFPTASWFLPINAAFVYFVAYRLVPRLLMRFAYWPFFAWYCVTLLACLSLDFYWGEVFVYRIWPVATYSHPHDTWHVFATIFDPGMFTVVNFMAGLCVGGKIYKFWRAEVWMKWQTEQDKARAELELLKTQLKPHFLYNTLTHLHNLVAEASSKAPQQLLRLSAILSYILYESRAAEVPLEQEIAICKEYIALERERHNRWLEVSLDVFGLPAGKRIAPMVLLPFIGNAFPERERVGERSWMAFELSVEGNQLLLRIIHEMGSAREKRFPAREEAIIQAAADRLRLLYPGRHSISSKSRGEADILALTIDLDPAIPGTPPAERYASSQGLLRYAVFDY